MEDVKIQKVGYNILKILSERGLSQKNLAERSGIPITTLSPILAGKRDFRLSNLTAIASTLGVSTDELLEGAYTNKITKRHNHEAKYIVVFINNFSFSYVRVINLETDEETSLMLPYAVFCINDADSTLDRLSSEISKITKIEDMSQIALYSSVVCYEYIPGRENLIAKGSDLFNKFMIEPDWLNIHKSNFGNKSAILLTITNGFSLSYSLDDGQTISKHQGYGFPLSDEAGNIWLGCQALKHAISVTEGVEERTMLSDKILATFESDLNLITTKVYDDYIGTYNIAANIVKELATKPGKATDVVKESYNNIYKHIEKIDKNAGQKLPICIAGDLGYLYEEFIPESRLVKQDHENMLEKQFKYAIEQIKSVRED